MAMTIALEDVIKDVISQFESIERGSGVVVGIMKTKNSIPNLNGDYLVYAKLSETQQAKATLVGSDDVIPSYRALIDYFQGRGIKIIEDKYEFP